MTTRPLSPLTMLLSRHTRRSYSAATAIWHYVPMLARKHGALRSGAPFKLPAAIERIRRRLAGADDGNRQMVDILTAVLADGLLPAVEAA